MMSVNSSSPTSTGPIPDGTKPEKLRLSLGYNSGGNWHEVTGTSSQRATQANIPPRKATYMTWNKSPPTPLFERLFDPALPADQKVVYDQPYEVRLTGFNRTASDPPERIVTPDISTPPHLPNIWSSPPGILADGPGGQFRIHQDINDGKTYLQPPPYTPAVDHRTAIKCRVGHGDPEVHIAINDDCDVELTFLDWEQVPEVIPESKLYVEIGRWVGSTWHTVYPDPPDGEMIQFDGDDDADPSNPNAPRRPLMDWSEIETRLRLPEDTTRTDAMTYNTRYEARITGYYDSANTFQSIFPNPPGQGPWLSLTEFWVVKNTGGDRMYSKSPDPADPTNTVTKAHPPGGAYCNITPGPPELETIIVPICGIQIDKLWWHNPWDASDRNPNLAVAIVNDATDAEVFIDYSVRQVAPLDSHLWIPFTHVDPNTTTLEGMLKSPGAKLHVNVMYRLEVVGYSDTGGVFHRLPSQTASGEPIFTIRVHRDSPAPNGQILYYMDIGNGTRHMPSNNQPNQPCNPAPCPPPCSSGCRATLPNPYRIDLAELLPAKYPDNYIGNIENTWWWENRFPTARSFRTRTLNGPSYYTDVPNMSMPNEIIPDGRDPEVTDLDPMGIRFDYDFKDDKRDSVTQFFGQTYRPITYFAWHQPPTTITGAPYRQTPFRDTKSGGWHDTWYLDLTPTQLEWIDNNNNFQTVTTGFNPSSSTGLNRNNSFTTNRDLSYDISQTDRLAGYRWSFDWKIKAKHRHIVAYDHYGRVPYAYDPTTKRVVTGYYEDYEFTYTDANGDEQTETRTRTVVTSDNTYDLGYTRHPLPTSSGGPDFGTFYSGTLIEVAYIYSLSTKTITEWSYFYGNSKNCSWVLIVKKPVCNVRRRLIPGGSERQRNPADSNEPYEIFPAGLDTSFSQMHAYNDNKFELDPTIRYIINPHPGAWTPKRHSNNGRYLSSVGTTDTTLTNPRAITPRNGRNGAIYVEEQTSLDWPGEYRVRWHLEWDSQANGNWPNGADVPDGRDPTPTWQGLDKDDDLWCAGPPRGLQVFVSAKPPVCRVKYTVFEFADPESRIRISLDNPYNYVHLTIPDNNPTANRAYHVKQSGTTAHPDGLVEFNELPGGINIPPAWDIKERVGGVLTALNLVSDDGLTYPRPDGILPGKYEYDWTIRARRGIEWWSTQDNQKQPGAWWDDDPDVPEKIGTSGQDDCEEDLRIVRIPFFKAFVGGISAGGRFGIGDEFDSCGNDAVRYWIDSNPTTPQGVWGHSANTTSLSTAVGSSVSSSLRAQNLVGGVYSSGHTDQDPGSTPPPKSLTYANNDSNLGFGGNFSNARRWRCIPNYWRQPTKDAHGNDITPDTTSTTLGVGANLVDGDVKIYQPATGLLTIDGDFRDPGDEEIRTTIYVDGDLRIDENVINMATTPTTYHGFSDMGLIQIIVKGNILIDPGVTRIDAMLVAYPEADGSKGAIDLCASVGGLNDVLVHYTDCGGLTNNVKQLKIYGTLVAQRIYFNRITNTLNKEPYPKANRNNTVASEVIIFSPAYQVATPAASIFEDWAKHPESRLRYPHQPVARHNQPKVPPVSSGPVRGVG